MQATWILSANASRARFFSQHGNADPLEEINNMVNEGVRLDNSELETDRYGPTSAGQSIHNTGGATPNKTYEPAVTPDKHEAEKFARDIAAFLLQAYRDGRFQKLSLVVSPKFLGMLRTLLDPQLEKVVELQIDKDLTQFGPEQLLDQVRQYRQVH